MNVKQRKEKEKEKMRKKIISVAIELFIEDGYEHVSMRKIAAKIHYSPTTIYLYFKNKKDVFYHIHEYLFEDLYNRLKPAELIDTPIERIRYIYHTYIGFAIENPESYRLMMLIETPSEDIGNENQWNFGMKCLHIIENGIVRLHQLGQDQTDRLHLLTFSMLSYLHGISSLAIQKRTPIEYQKNMDTLVSNSIDFLTDNFKK